MAAAVQCNADSSSTCVTPPTVTPPPEMEGVYENETEKLNLSVHFSNHSPFNSLFEVSCPTPWSVAKRIAGELVLYIRYGFRLLGYLGLGYKWALSLYQLIVYATLLLPGFIQVILFYFFSPRVSRSVAYGAGPRQRLDMYLPKNRKPGQKYPVVVFITGGAWTIGYKAWGALLAKRLSQAGALVACLDYRNFPQGGALQMLEDVNRGIAWVCNQCVNYQGDPENVVLCGQSAGGQLGALALIRQMEGTYENETEKLNLSVHFSNHSPFNSLFEVEQATLKHEVLGAQPAWDPTAIRAFVGISGAYDLEGLAGHLHSRGLYNNLFSQIMSINGEPAISELSPLHAAQAWSFKGSPQPMSFTTMEGPILTETSIMAQSSPLLSAPAFKASQQQQQQQQDDLQQLLLQQQQQPELETSQQQQQQEQQQLQQEQYDLQQEKDCSKAAMTKRRSPGANLPSSPGSSSSSHFGALMPATLLIHGTADKSVPFASSQLLHEALERAGVASTCKLIEGRTHTSFLLEGAMKGGRDELMELMQPVVSGSSKTPPKPRRYAALCPAILCNLAGYVCPF